jgi:hypothetical protein
VDTKIEMGTVSVMAEESKKARRQRRSFTDEFKAGAVRLVLERGKTIAELLSVGGSTTGRKLKHISSDGGWTLLHTRHFAIRFDPNAQPIFAAQFHRRGSCSGYETGGDTSGVAHFVLTHRTTAGGGAHSR